MEYNFTFNRDDLKVLQEAAAKNGQSFLDYISEIQENNSEIILKDEENNK